MTAKKGYGEAKKLKRGFEGRTRRYYAPPRKPYIAPNPDNKDHFTSMIDLAVLAEFLPLTDVSSLMQTCKKFHKGFSSDRVWQRLYSNEFGIQTKINSNLTFQENFRLMESLPWNRFDSEPEVQIELEKGINSAHWQKAAVVSSKETVAAISTRPISNNNLAVRFQIEHMPTKGVIGVGVADSSVNISTWTNGSKITSIAWSDGYISGLNRGQKFGKYAHFAEKDIITVSLNQKSKKIEWFVNGKSIYSWTNASLAKNIYFVACIDEGGSLLTLKD